MFLTRPISAAMLIAAVLLVLVIALPNIRKKREEAFQEEAACTQKYSGGGEGATPGHVPGVADSKATPASDPAQAQSSSS